MRILGYDDTADLFERLQSVEPTWNPYLPDGSPNYGYGKRDGNPLYWLDKLTNQNNTRRTTLNIGADLELIKDKLYLRENSSLYYSDYTKETFDKAYRDYWNENTERKASFEYTRTIQQQHSLQLEYTDTFKEKHNLSAMVGGEYFENQYLQYKGTADGAPFDQIPTLNVSGRDNMWSYSYRQGYRIASGFARVTYDYERRYLFTAVARYDGISKLSDNRWGFFPGVSAGWNVHEEAFFKDSELAKVVSTVKPRISYGINGNVNGIGNYDVYGIYSFCCDIPLSILCTLLKIKYSNSTVLTFHYFFFAKARQTDTIFLTGHFNFIIITKRFGLFCKRYAPIHVFYPFFRTRNRLFHITQINGSGSQYGYIDHAQHFHSFNMRLQAGTIAMITFFLIYRVISFDNSHHLRHHIGCPPRRPSHIFISHIAINLLSRSYLIKKSGISTYNR